MTILLYSVLSFYFVAGLFMIKWMMEAPILDEEGHPIEQHGNVLSFAHAHAQAAHLEDDVTEHAA